MTNKKVIDIIVAEAKKEDAEAKKQRKYKRLEKKKRLEEEYGITENSLILPYSHRKIVDIRDFPIEYKTFISFNPNVKATTGLFSLRYIPTTDRTYVRGKPFNIIQDLVKMRVVVSGPKHWKHLAERIPELGWVERNSTLTNNLFAIAKKHPGITFPFTVKWIEYGDMIQKKAEELGMFIDNKPFVAYCCSIDAYTKYYKDKKLAPMKEEKDYVKEVAAANEIASKEGEEEL